MPERVCGGGGMLVRSRSAETQEPIESLFLSKYSNYHPRVEMTICRGLIYQPRSICQIKFLQPDANPIMNDGPPRLCRNPRQNIRHNLLIQKNASLRNVLLRMPLWEPTIKHTKYECGRLRGCRRPLNLTKDYLL